MKNVYVALLRARDIVTGMLIERPDVRRVMIAQHIRVAILGVQEGTVDLPSSTTGRSRRATIRG